MNFVPELESLLEEYACSARHQVPLLARIEIAYQAGSPGLQHVMRRFHQKEDVAMRHLQNDHGRCGNLEEAKRAQ